MASSSNPALPKFTHDVFVNYSYEDTGNKFTSHLKSAFARERFNVAMNDMIDKGNEISDILFSQISESLVFVVIFSKSYASSPDCLDELVKIIESQEEKGRHVLPVFLGVEPSDVRKQTGAFGDGFHKLIQSEQFKEKKQIWRSTLMKTANISGWDSTKNISEAKIVEGVVERIMKILVELPLGNFSNGFVANYQVEEVESMLQLQSKTNVQFLGIWGMPGIGKTTISNIVFDRISILFDASCYLQKVTQMLARKGLQSLAKKMFSQLGIDCNPWTSRSARRAIDKRRVLIILDDVSNSPGLKSFVKEYLSYGCPGSRVVLTSRDEQVLKSYQCEYIYEVKKLNDYESLKLFGFHAFREQTCQEMYGRLLNKALSYCGGLPLALEVLGSNLGDKNFEEWESELTKLENIPDRTIYDVIRISYEGLDENEKEIFLNIACVFCGWDEDEVKRILDVCGLYAVSGISRLRDKALITISKGILRMHDLVEQFGQYVVLSECKEEPGNRSRLCRFEDFCHVVEHNTGSEKVEYISVDLSKATKDMYMMPEFFDKMPRLRVLDLRHVHYFRGIKLHLPKGLRSPSNKLRYLRWDSYPLTSLPEKFTCANHLVELQLRGSKVKQLWSEGAEPHLPMLECMDLSGSMNLIKLLDFSKTPNLKTLEAVFCHRLIEIPSSIQHLSKLQSLQMGWCENLSKLPELPQSIVSLNFERTKIEELPSSIVYLSQLHILYLRDCKNLRSLPDLPSSLEILAASGCTSLKIEGDYIFGSSLIHINLSETDLESLPASIKHLSHLKRLYLSDCKNLKSLPDLPSSLQILFVDGCTSLKIEGDNIFGSSLRQIGLCGNDLESSPASIKHLSHLIWLNLKDCKNFKSLPDLPSTLLYLNAEGCTSLTTVGNFFGEDHCERHLKFNLGGCFNLDQNFRIRSLVNAPLRLKSMKLCIPGSEVLDWFKYKEDGSSIMLKMFGGTLSYLSKLAFCIVIEDFSNIINKKKISSPSFWKFRAECNCQFVTEFGEQHGASRRFFEFNEFDIKSENVLLWIGPGRRGYDDEEDGILSSPLALVRFSEAKFEFRAHIETSNVKYNEKIECKIIQCGVSQVGVWETHKKGISQREYEEEEEPSPKRLKCDQPPVTPDYI